MKAPFLLLLPVLLMAREYHNPAGFRADLPEGWQAVQSKAGHFVLVSPDPQRYVFVQPVLNRTADCADTLRQVLAGGGQFKGAQAPEILPVGKGMAMARFLFQNGQVRGEMLCAETSRRGGTLYGLAAPVQDFNRELPRLVAVLKSFAFEAHKQGSALSSQIAIPQLVSWQEPHELAYTMGVPQSWRVSGGIRRLDVTHYNDGIEISSPDGAAVIRVGDNRIGSCTVPGPNSMAAPGTYGMCAMQSSRQFGSGYLQQMLARDLGITIAANSVQWIDRPDVAQQADELPRSMGLQAQSSASEFRFTGTRGSAPVAGALLATTKMFYGAAAGRQFILGTLSFGISGFVGPPDQFGMLGRLTGVITTSIRINPAWWSQTQQINRQVAEATLATMRHQAEQQQQSFWDRMAASDRRREGVNDILGSTVRLSDGQGNQYQAKAGSNYYFRDDDAARTAGRPDDAVTRGDLWPATTVDLTPLQVIR